MQANVWIAVFGYVGNYFWTHYFFELLGASYTMKSHRLNKVGPGIDKWGALSLGTGISCSFCASSRKCQIVSHWCLETTLQPIPNFDSDS